MIRNMPADQCAAAAIVLLDWMIIITIETLSSSCCEVRIHACLAKAVCSEHLCMAYRALASDAAFMTVMHH